VRTNDDSVHGDSSPGIAVVRLAVIAGLAAAVSAELRPRAEGCLITDGKKPGVAFWAAVVAFLLLVVYPLSRGPAIWLLWHNRLPSSAIAPLDFLYAPLYKSPKPIQDAVDRYDNLWRPAHARHPR